MIEINSIEDINRLASVVKGDDEDNAGEYRKEYEGERSRRPESLENVQKDYQIGGDGYDPDTGEPIDDNSKTVVVSKFVFPFPKKIVRFAVVFLFGGNMSIEGSPSQGVQDFITFWSTKLRMQSVLKSLCRTVKIETRGALLFYAVPKSITLSTESKNSIRVKLLDGNSGAFAPHFDEYGDMDAFLHLHKIKEEEKDILVLDIYDETSRYRYFNRDNEWDLTPETVKHLFNRIPVVYAEQDKPEWEDVARLIDGFEVRLSKTSDSNSYTGDPIIVTKGKVTLPDKNKIGKVLEFEGEETENGTVTYGDAHYLTHDNMPESIKLELENLWKGIHFGTSVADISFENLKGMGNIASASLETMFLDPILKANDDRETWDVVVSRCVSIVKDGMASIMNIKQYSGLQEEDISVSFNLPLPKNEKEYIELLGDSVRDGIMSKKTATSLHPQVKNADEEYKNITEEKKLDDTLFQAYE